MRQILTILYIILSLSLLSQERRYSTFYEQRTSLFDILPINSDDIVFVGNSITNGGEACCCFESGIIPLASYPIKGVIRFIDSLRRMMDKIPHTYMAVSSDKGDSLDVHLPYKPFTRANLINRAGLPASTFKTKNKNNLDKMNKTIERLPDYPIRGGVSAPLAGVYDNKLIVAGGCNFPDTPASEGGKKEFYDDIFYLDTSNPNSNWTKGEPLAYKVAYGAYVTTEDGVVCIGGQNDEGTINKTVLIYFDTEGQKIKVDSLPTLPVGILNAGATVINKTIYLAGGVSSDERSDYIYSLNLNDIQKGWQRILTNLKEERQQPVVFAQDGKLFMAGGYNEKDAIVYSDVLQFHFSNHQWSKVADIRTDGKLGTLVGAGSVNLSSSYTLFTGGVDYEIFSSALQRIKKRQEAVASGNSELAETLQQVGKEYMYQAPEWYKFATTLLSFDTKTKEWKRLGDYPQLARAGAGIAIHKNELYNVCGELKPGIRTNEVYKLVFKNLNAIKL